MYNANNKKNDNYVRILVKLNNSQKIVIAEGIQSVITPNNDRKYLVKCIVPHNTTSNNSNNSVTKPIIVNLALV